MSGQVFAATELPTSATVNVDSETLSECTIHCMKQKAAPVITYYVDYASVGRATPAYSSLFVSVCVRRRILESTEN